MGTELDVKATSEPNHPGCLLTVDQLAAELGSASISNYVKSTPRPNLSRLMIDSASKKQSDLRASSNDDKKRAPLDHDLIRDITFELLLQLVVLIYWRLSNNKIIFSCCKRTQIVRES